MKELADKDQCRAYFFERGAAAYHVVGRAGHGTTHNQ